MKTLILDFDQTVADTSVLEPLRRARNWASVYASIHQIKLYPGMLEFLKKSQQAGFKLAVVTNSPKSYCEKALAHLGIQVDAVVGYHDTSRRKPHPDPILLALKLVGGTPSLSLGLGDAANDIVAYKAAGIRSVACLWGCESAQSLAAVSPCLTIRNADELERHLLESSS